MKNIFVLGGTGFVGTHVCEKLARMGWKFTVATRRRVNAQPILHLPGLTVQVLDVHDEAALVKAVAGHDAVVNLVGILHGSQATFEHVHVALPKKIAHACAMARVKYIVHLSALGADALQSEKSPSLYLRTKGEGESVLTQSAVGAGAGSAGRVGFDLTVIRPSVIFGEDDQFLNLFAKLQSLLPVLPLAGADARFQPVWVEDVATAVVRCLDGAAASLASPRVIEAAGPEVFTLKQLAQISAQLSGVAEGMGRPVVSLPDWLGRLQATVMSLLPGQPWMSVDNLDSMKVDNVASATQTGLQALGIQPADLCGIASDYLRKP